MHEGEKAASHSSVTDPQAVLAAIPASSCVDLSSWLWTPKPDAGACRLSLDKENAREPFRMVQSPTAIAIGIWWTCSRLHLELPMADEPVGEGQTLVQAREVRFSDGILRQVVLAHVLDVETGQQQFLALAENDLMPTVHPWTSMLQ